MLQAAPPSLFSSVPTSCLYSRRARCWSDSAGVDSERLQDAQQTGQMAIHGRWRLQRSRNGTATSTFEV